MTEENKLLVAKYIAPIHYLATNETWESPDDISAKGLYFTYFGKADMMAYYGISVQSRVFEVYEKIDCDKF